MKLESQPLVSVVTPVYNCAEYLSECIESVLAQTYQNWDYTIVDNYSDDGSTEIAKRYAEKDSRIRVYRNQQLLPAVPNYNLSLGKISAASKYCKIVFADDWLFQECLEQMVALAEAYPSVGIVGAYVSEGSGISCTGLPVTNSFVPGREICRRHLLDKLYVFGSANSVLYRSDLVRGRVPFYNESNIHSDTEVCFALLRSSDFGFIHQVLTFTRVREQSLSTWSTQMQTSFAGDLQILVAFGSDYLTSAELNHLLKTNLQEYYRFLGKTVLLGHIGQLNYHCKRFLEIGLKFSYARVVHGAFATLFRLLRAPGHSFVKLLHWRNRSKLKCQS